MKKHHVYILYCQNDYYYIGYALDVKKRFEQHLLGKGAKFTKINKPVNIASTWEFDNKSIALKVEYHLKKLSRIKKENLIKKPSLIYELLDFLF